MTDHGTYTCELCRGTFDKTISDEQAVAERTVLWPNEEPDGFALVCDECFEEIMGKSVTRN